MRTWRAEPMWTRLKDSLFALLDDPGDADESPAQLAIVSEDAQRLVVAQGYRQLVFDRRLRTVSVSDQVLARFDAIESVDISCHGGDETPVHWRVCLRLRGWFASVNVGQTRDDAEASIVAAHIGGFTGRKVISL